MLSKMLSKNDTNEFLLNSRMLEDAQILLVDNDRDSRELYTFLLEEQGAKMKACESIQVAFDFLDENTPHLLICEIRFLGESVLPLIRRVKSLEFNQGSSIPILVISTCASVNLAQQLSVKVEGYLRKPIDPDDFLNQVKNLARLSKTIYPSSLQAWMFKQNPVNRLSCGAGAN
jgi:response regulator RpfG family c-di-GMP phosphodiesterase